MLREGRVGGCAGAGAGGHQEAAREAGPALCLHPDDGDKGIFSL